MRSLNYQKKNLIFYPKAVETTFGITYRADLSCLSEGEKNLPKSINALAQESFAKELINGLFKVVMAEVGNNYYWLGSNYLFLDRATAVQMVDERYYPSNLKMKSQSGVFKGLSKETYSLNFFIYLMHWSLHQINKK